MAALTTAGNNRASGIPVAALFPCRMTRFSPDEGSTGIHVSSIWPLEALARKGSNADPEFYPDRRNATRRLTTLGGNALKISERHAAGGKRIPALTIRSEMPAEPIRWRPRIGRRRAQPNSCAALNLFLFYNALLVIIETLEGSL